MARGERVLLYLQNSPQFVIAYYAILRADAVVVPVSPMNRAGELSHYVEDSDARVAFAGQDVLEHIAPLGLERLIVARYADYLPATIDLPLPDFLRAAHPLEFVEGSDGGESGTGRTLPARRPRGDALHLGHDRQAQGAACTRTRACRRPPCPT